LITTAGNTLVLNSVIAGVLDTVSVISVKNASGEFFRKIPTATEIITAQQIHFIFYLNESEANDTITGFSLYSNGTTVLGTGTEIASNVASLTKDNTQSLQVEWTVSIV
jgi:calcineurin-like phosphoesterase